MITAIVRVLLSTRDKSLSPTGKTIATFQVIAGTVTPVASTLVVPPPLPVPPVPTPPEIIYSSLPGNRVRR